MVAMETYGRPREGYTGYTEGGYGRSTRRTVLGLPGVVSPQFSEEEFTGSDYSTKASSVAIVTRVSEPVNDSLS